MAPRVLHLVGSAQSAFLAELSCLYARGCLDAVDHHAQIAHVTPGARWRFADGLSDGELDAAEPLDLAAAVARLNADPPDVMVPHMFCLAGMTRYRALFELLGIPYVGNRPATMAAAADKSHARALVAAAGVAVPAAHVAGPGDACALELPVVVKPVDADNSTGMTLVRELAAFDAAVRVATQHAARALVETFVPPGREVRCATLALDGGPVQALPLEEYPVDERRPVRAAADKIIRRDGRLRLGAKDPASAWIVAGDDPVVPAVQDAAVRCHEAMGCRHFGLFDFRIDRDGRPWFLEAGPYCSFSPDSVVATMARAAGIPTEELFTAAVGAALSATEVSACG